MQHWSEVLRAVQGTSFVISNQTIILIIKKNHRVVHKKNQHHH